MALLPSPITHSGFRRAWEIASDLFIATAVLWTLPLVLALIAALVKAFAGTA